MKGIQGAGVFNYSGGTMNGIQAAGIFNRAGAIKGVQLGLLNISGEGSGVLVGLVNISKAEDSVAIGLLNIIRGGILHPAIFYDDMKFINLSFRSGSKHVYSVFTVGVQEETIRGDSGENNLLIYRSGLGLEYGPGRFFLDLDITCGNILNLSASGDWENFISNRVSGTVQARLTVGLKVVEHLGVFSGISYDYIYRPESASPDPNGRSSSYTFEWSDSRNIHKIGFFNGIQF
jgi:hypothetical protein